MKEYFAGLVDSVTSVNSAVNNFVWGIPMLVLLVGTGILMTVLTRFFQLSHIGHWFQNTIGGIFRDRHITKHTDKEDKAISQFQSLCTALAATIGTGNIVGVASALISGGPGAIFWMWIVAFFGMMTNYSENVLGIYYRRRNTKGEWCGGAMYYLKDGLGSYKGCKQIGAVLAVLFSVFCLLASFGIGNMSQVNSIAANMEAAFSIPTVATGIGLMVLAALVIVGGLKRIASVTEKLVPFMAIAYILGALAIFITNIGQCGAVFSAIFKGAFGLKAVGGGIVGSGVKLALTWGDEAGCLLQRSGPWFLRDGALQLQCKRACPAGYVGYFRSVCRHHGRLHADCLFRPFIRTCGSGDRRGLKRGFRFRPGGRGLCHDIWLLRPDVHRRLDPAVCLLHSAWLEPLRL